jgi:Holliday junction DNA helicase RuvB
VAEVHGEGRITEELLKQALEMLEVDPLGLDNSDCRLLLTLIDKFNGGPVGIETIAAAISEDIGTIEEVIEPYLMQTGLLKRTPRGRVATPTAYKHFGKKPTEPEQSSLI